MKLKLTLYLGLCLLYSSQPIWAEDEPLTNIQEATEQHELAKPEPIRRELRLHQQSFPNDLMVLPSAEEHVVGEIFVQRMNFDEVQERRTGIMDFRVEGVRSDIDMDVYLAFGTRPVLDWEYKQGVALDFASLEIISAVTIPAREIIHFMNHPTSFSTGGFAYVPSNSLVFAVNLAGLLDAPQLYSDELYFQAIAVPAGSKQFDALDVQSSEIDFFRIIR